MKDLKEAVSTYRLRHPKATPEELEAFIAGWTAHEILTQLKEGHI